MKNLMYIKGMIKTALVLCLSVPLYVAADSERILKSSVTPDKGSVGQQFTYTLSIAGRDLEGVKVVLPENGEIFPQPEKNEFKPGLNKNGKEGTDDESAVPLYIINSSSRGESESDGMRQITVRVDLTCYRTGVHQLPEIAVTDSDGVKIGYSIPAVTIEELNKEGQPEDIEPPLELSGNYTRLIIVILAVIVTAAAAYFIYRYIRNRRKTQAEPEIKQTPLEFFMSEIERLKLRECIDEGRINDYVFGMSITFRRFLSMELGFDAAEMTTGEISAVIRKYLSNGKPYAADIVRNMEIWDLSKFAEFTLSKEVLSANLADTIASAEKLPGIRRGADGQP